MAVATVPDTDPRTPTHPGGGHFYAALIAPGAPSVFADTLTEIVGELIPSYSNQTATDAPVTDTDEALIQRIDFLAELAANQQAIMAAAARDEDRSFTEDELTAIFTPKDQAAPVAEAWDDEDLPLLLLATSYAPHSPHPLPTGRGVRVLNPLDERTFLESVAFLLGGALMIR